jgi:hypothetical protein
LNGDPFKKVTCSTVVSAPSTKDPDAARAELRAAAERYGLTVALDIETRLRAEPQFSPLVAVR